jgi:hypothetical protein
VVVGIYTVSERIQSQDEFYRQMLENFGSGLRVSMPGIISDFDPITQTATVQPALREKINTDGTYNWINLPLLLDVPICLPRGGGYAITVPIKPGDECLVIFNDMCIDAWFSNGDIQNQIEKRRHDLSDAVCIPGIWSQPNRVTNYSTNSMQLRNEDGTQMIDISSSGINLIGNIKKNGVPL